MDFYKLQDNLYIPIDRWFLGSIDFDNEWEFWQYLNAGEINIPNKQLEISVKEEGIPLDFTFADFGILIVNEKTANLFNDNEVQLIPIRLKGYKNINKYFVMVVKNVLDCVDENKSVFTKWEKDNPIRPDKAGQYKSIYKLVIKSELANGHNIFRIKNYDVIIAISETLKKRLEELRITGIKFKKVT